MAHHAVEQFRVVRELCRVFECESGGAFGRAIDDESRDLEDLTLAPDGGLRLLLRGDAEVVARPQLSPSTFAITARRAAAIGSAGLGDPAARSLGVVVMPSPCAGPLTDR